MAGIPFLHNIDLNDNQLLNAKLHTSGTAPANPGTGTIWYDSTNSLVKIYNGGWTSIAGDITGVTSSTTGQLNVTNENGPIPNLSIITAAIANGGTGLATADQIHTFVTEQTEDIVSSTSGTAAVATTITIADESSDTTCFPLFATAATGNLGVKSGTNLTFNSSTGVLAATGFSGNLTGNADTVTTNADLTGDIISDGNATAIALDVIVNADVKSDAAIAYSKLGTIPTWNQNTDGSAATVTTAAQPNITSLGTLTTLTIDNIIINGTNIGHTSDTDSMAIASNGVVTFSQIPVLPANTIDSTHYVDGSIDTAHIADDQVTLAKMAGLASTKFILGNGSGNPAAVSMSGDATMTNAGVVTVTQSAGNFTVTGDLLVSGATTTVNTANLLVEDPLIGMASGNGANTVDIGIWAKYTSSGAKYTGLFRDASDSNIWKLFATTGNSHEAPGTGTTINTTNGFTLGHLELDTIEASTVIIPDNAIAVGKIAAGALPSDVTINNGNWSGTDLSVVNGGTGASSLNDLITLTTHTTGNYVGTITALTGLTSSAATTGEGTTHGLSVDAAQTQITSIGTITTGTWEGTTIAIDQGGTGQTSAATAFTALKQDATTSATGVVELATDAEVKAGAGASKMVDATQLGARSVVATIDSSAMAATSDMKAEIRHNLGTEDVTVELFEKTSKTTVYAEVKREEYDGTDSGNYITVYFASEPSEDIEVIIYSHAGATAAAAVAYL
jgi:hypothetical protein